MITPRPSSILRSVSRPARLAAALLAFACASAEAPSPEAAAVPPEAVTIAAPTRLEWLGEAMLPEGLEVDATPVGGLSGLVWSAGEERFLAISDDRSERAPARFYRLRIDLADGRLDDGDVVVEGATRLTRADGSPFASGTIDPEGLALAPDGALYVSSEGVAREGIPPFVSEVGRNGRVRRDLELPSRYLPDGRGKRGIRDNLAFECLSVTPDGRLLVAAIENALTTDGPEADVDVPSLSRVLVWSRASGGAPREYAYRVEPVGGHPPTPASFRVNGLDDILAIDDQRFLALEREFVAGVGLRLRLYLASLAGATEVSGLDGLDRQPLEPAHKQLLLDFADLGIWLENVEGMALGPRLADGRRLFVLVSDDNFDPPLERTRFLAFAWDDHPVEIAAVQGDDHRSPLAGQWVFGVEGRVTGVERGRAGDAIFLESWAPDDDAATSEGLRVEGELPAGLEVGMALRVGGRVEERSRDDAQLSVTTLRATAVETVADAPPLPPPVRIGTDRAIPAVIEDDALATFDPDRDRLDFWESVEGMRVEVPGGRVTGPTLRYGELVVAPERAAGERTAAGGLLLTPAGPSPERFVLSRRLVGELPELSVGARVAGPLTAVVDYSFANYKLLPVRPLAVVEKGVDCRPRTRLEGSSGTLTLAAFNVENLSFAGAPDRFEALGRALVEALAAPAVVALEEIEDDSGTARDDGIVTAERTLAAIADAVRVAGGPDYQPIWIDPELDREGGIPGGNIRVALLVDPLRAGFVRRGAAGALDATEPAGRAGALHLSLNPGRIEPRSPAFSLASGEGVRRSLAVELEVGGRPLFVVVNHWSSKYDDDRAFGAIQPPRSPTGAKRLAQAQVVRRFVDRLLAADPGARVVVLGDLNDVPWSESVVEIARPPLENLAGRLPANERYSFNFEGSAQMIDHVVVSPALAPEAEIEAVHLDSDCPDGMRISDHDPLIVRLRTGAGER